MWLAGTGRGSCCRCWQSWRRTRGRWRRRWGPIVRRWRTRRPIPRPPAPTPASCPASWRRIPTSAAIPQINPLLLLPCIPSRTGLLGPWCTPLPLCYRSQSFNRTLSQDAYEHAVDLEAEKAIAIHGRADAEAAARAAAAERAALQEQVHVRLPSRPSTPPACCGTAMHAEALPKVVEGNVPACAGWGDLSSMLKASSTRYTKCLLFWQHRFFELVLPRLDDGQNHSGFSLRSCKHPQIHVHTETRQRFHAGGRSGTRSGGGGAAGAGAGR